MNNLLTNSTAAERQRGCCWAETFESAAAIRNNGGVISGALGFAKPAYGALFDGTNDYITYPPNVQPFSGFGWSAVIEFFPTFDITADGSWYFFCDDLVATRIFRYKLGASNILVVRTGAATAILSSDYATWGSLWKHNQRNVLVVTARSGANAMYLNGVSIATSATAWTAQGLSNFTVGSGAAGILKFQGYLRSVKFFRHNAAAELLTAQEA